MEEGADLHAAEVLVVEVGGLEELDVVCADDVGVVGGAAVDVGGERRVAGEAAGDLAPGALRRDGATGAVGALRDERDDGGGCEVDGLAGEGPGGCAQDRQG